LIDSGGPPLASQREGSSRCLRSKGGFGGKKITRKKKKKKKEIISCPSSSLALDDPYYLRWDPTLDYDDDQFWEEELQNLSINNDASKKQKTEEEKKASRSSVNEEKNISGKN